METPNFENPEPSPEPALSLVELKRKKKREYDQARKVKTNFMKTFLADEAVDLAEKKMDIAEREKGRELLLPPIDDRYKFQRFWLKQAWDNFAQPILDYENLKKDIEKLPSNTTKREALRQLDAERHAAEGRLRALPDWNPDASDGEKKEYVRKLEKFLPKNF